MPNEFSLIFRWFKRAARHPETLVAVGDDAAVLAPPADQHLVVSVDTLIEGVHFPLQTSPSAIGHKALAVNLSDMAAMGAAPAWATLAISLPGMDEMWLDEFSHGFFALMDRYDVDLIGGDTTRGGLSITVQICGFVPPGQALRRDGARPGDVLYVTGTLGDAGLGLAWLQGRVMLDQEVGERVRARLDRPTPRVEAGLALRSLATAAIDISDGLLADLQHILRASGVGARLEVASLPLSRDVSAQPNAVDLALFSGDDYELLFTAAPAHEAELMARLRPLGVPVTRIGRIETQAGLRLLDADGRERSIVDPKGYDHFRGCS